MHEYGWMFGRLETVWLEVGPVSLCLDILCLDILCLDILVWSFFTDM